MLEPITTGQTLKTGRRDGRCSNLERHRRREKKKYRIPAPGNNRKARLAAWKAGTVKDAVIHQPSKPGPGLATPSPLPTTMPHSQWSRLPEAVFSDGECFDCHHYPNAMVTVQTELNPERAVRCTKCKKWMRPHKDQTR